MKSENIIIRGAREHNLKNINLELPRNKLIVVTGLSGSGKSSLAFDTIYAEGQRRFVESLSSYARQFLEQLQKPDVDFIEKKTAEEFKFGKDKTIISLRADDFATRHDMEVFVGKLSDRLKIDRFAYHDLGRMIDLDQGQVKNVNKED